MPPPLYACSNDMWLWCTSQQLASGAGSSGTVAPVDVCPNLAMSTRGSNVGLDPKRLSGVRFSCTTSTMCRKRCAAHDVTIRTTQITAREAISKASFPQRIGLSHFYCLAQLSNCSPIGSMIVPGSLSFSTGNFEPTLHRYQGQWHSSHSHVPYRIPFRRPVLMSSQSYACSRNCSRNFTC